jgi:hypothetical protein
MQTDRQAEPVCLSVRVWSISLCLQALSLSLSLSLCL